MGAFRIIGDLTGMVFGRWEVIEEAPRISKYRKAWLCKCSCNKKTLKIVPQDTLLRGESNSCGCLWKEKFTSKKHGFSGYNENRHPLYTTWGNIVQRCTNPNNDNYSCYGGRGIKLCDEWRNNSISFIEWAVANGWEKGLTVERIDVNGNYEPGNCTLIPANRQGMNKRDTIYVEYKGEEHPLKLIVEKYSMLTYHVVYGRIKHGWDIEKALTTPKAEKRK